MLKYYYELLVDDRPILTPDAGVQITRSDIISDDSGFDERHVYHQVVARSGVYKLDFNYSNLTEEDFRYIYSLLMNSGNSFTCKFRDLNGNEWEITAYCSKVSASMYNAATGHYKKLKFTIQEC